MAVNVQGVIRGIIQAGEVAQSAEAGGGRKPVITISRSMGSGGNEVAKLVAAKLGIDCWGKEILDAVAKSAEVEEGLIKDLHEKVSRASDSWLYALVFGKNVTQDDYLHRLVTTVRGLYWKGGVIIGRGSHVILEGRDVLRVRVTGSNEACAKRIAQQQGIDLREAKKMVRESNTRRGQFTWNMFRSRLNDPTNFDMVINTDNFGSYQQVADIVVAALDSLAGHGSATGTTRR